MVKILATLIFVPLLVAASAHSNSVVRLTNKSGHTLEIELMYGVKTVWHRTETASLKNGASRQWPLMDGPAWVYDIRAEDSAEPLFRCAIRNNSPVHFEIGDHPRLNICTFRYISNKTK